MKTFKSITIATNEAEKKTHIKAIDTKKSHFNALFSYLQQFVNIDNKEVFEGNIYNEFISRFSNKHFANYPTLRIEKIAELHDCHLHKIDALIKAFESIKIEWDFKTNESKQSVDFDIKTQYQEQNDRYKNTMQLIKALDTIKENRHVYLADIVRGLNGVVAYDFSNQKVVPNIAFVLGEKERATY